MEEFDYIVVGAGSAGCAVAARLAEDRDTRVLLLEAGPKDRNIWIHIPIGYGKTMFNSSVNWQFYSEPEPHLNNRRIYQPRGKVLGGSSSINGLIYIRGHANDFDSWKAMGNEGWGWDDVLPYFKRAEGNERGASALHGGDGPLRVSDVRGKHELVEAFIEGAAACGIQRNDDFNGPTQDGVGYVQLTTGGGRRCSTARGYLRNVKGDGALTVETGAFARKILFDGLRAVGVQYERDGLTVEAYARHEVIVSAGAFQSPQLLQCSGVGPAELLRDIGVPPVVDLPGVGQNLHDHLQVRVMYRCTKPITTNDSLRTLWGRAQIGLQWLLQQKGPVAAGIQLACLFARSRAEETQPDIQFHFGTISADKTAGQPHDFPGFTMSVCQLRPTSRGHLKARSKDMTMPPEIVLNYFETEEDRRVMIAGVRLAQDIARSKGMSDYVAAPYLPSRFLETDREIEDFIRETATTIFHPVGTCRIGHDDMAVVDPRLRVHGVSGLRVVDASVMPTVPSGNTNAASIAIGEYASDIIKSDRLMRNMDTPARGRGTDRESRHLSR